MVIRMTHSTDNQDLFNALRHEGSDPTLEQALFRELFESAPEGIVLLDNHDCIVRVNSRFLEMFGYDKGEVIGQPINRLIVDQSLSEEASELTQRVIAHQPIKKDTIRCRKDGARLHVSILGCPVTLAEGQVGVYGIYRDESERVRAEAALRESEKRYRIMAENTGQLVYDYDLASGAIHWSGAIERVTGETAEALAGVGVDEWLERIHPDDRDEAHARLQKAEREGSHYHVEYRFRTGRGGYIHTEDNGTFLLDEQGQAYRMIGTMSDVSERHRASREIAHQAAHDPLTGLFNRRKFEQVLDSLLAHREANGPPHAVLYMDLDRFKVVNDTCGHHAGDELLRQLAGLLKRQLRSSDTLARLGGDEFGLILHGCGMVKAEEIGQKILALVKNFSFSWREHRFTIGISIGLVDVAGHTSLAEVLMAADQACYSAKRQGRNRLRIHPRDDGDLHCHQSEIDAATQITDALREDRFELYCQRIEPLPDQRGERHCEILLRMRDRAGGLVMPDRFLPAAERYNLMSAIDRWVVTHVFEGIRRRIDSGRHREGERYSINLSGSSFAERGFAAFVADELERAGVPPRAIAFEITESSAMLNLDRAVEFIEAVRALGVKVMLDDFGRGLSSFGYLKTLPVDYLKIDGELVRAIADGRIDLAMVEAIHRAGEVIGIQTIAEHVSSSEILECLRKVGVQYGQGFHLHKPEPWGW